MKNSFFRIDLVKMLLIGYLSDLLVRCVCYVSVKKKIC